MTLHLSAQLEFALTVAATRLGTTPDALAAQLIESQLPAVQNAMPEIHNSIPTEPRTMLDRWRAHLDAIKADHTSRTGPTNLSEDTGRRFAELLEEKRRQGRL